MKLYQQAILFVSIGVAEYALSWLNHKINLSVLMRKKHLAMWLDVIANTLSEVIPFVVYVSTQNWIFMIPRIIGNTWGTRVVAGRKIMKSPKKPQESNPGNPWGMKEIIQLAKKVYLV